MSAPDNVKLPELYNKVLEAIKKIDELYRLINQSTLNENNLEAIAAKIISEQDKRIDALERTVKSCPCNKEILDAIRNQPSTSSTSGPIVEKPKSTNTNTLKYSFPNYNVGNKELGSSEIPKALTWPFGS